MISIRRSSERGHVDHGWLLARHTFSFASYRDRAHMGFRVLRVLNEDTIRPGQGFGKHGHEDMEIVTWVLEGALRHEDSMGQKSVLEPGDVQVMSAGTGVTHSEFNHSDDEPLRLFQLWILPDRSGHEPAYGERSYPAQERRDRLCVIATGDRDRDALPIHQDAHAYASLLGTGHEVEHELGAGRGAWIQVASGAVEVEGATLGSGDGAAVEEVRRLRIRATEDAELLLLDLP